MKSFYFQTTVTPIQQIFEPVFLQKNVEVFVKRDDLLHPSIMGNKWRKLKYNLQEAKNQGFKSILTFGGAFSNHIYAVASAGAEFGFETIGIIRGNELSVSSNETLKYAHKMGMKLIFVDRTEYLDKAHLAQKFGVESYIIPEGGTNELAIAGVEELLHEIDNQIDANFICTSIGTGGTLAGLLKASKENCKIVGFMALKGVSNLDQLISSESYDFKTNFQLFVDYHFGGYGQHNAKLLQFLQNFEKDHNIPLEQVYTGKMFYGVLDLISKDFFPRKSKIVMLHTGGLQGKLSSL